MSKQIINAILILLFPVFLASAQNPGEAFVHIQSLNPGFHYFINDSINISVRNRGDLAYVSKTNINNMEWEHIKAYPNKQLPVGKIVMKNSMEGVVMKPGNFNRGENGVSYFTNDGGLTFTQGSIPLSSVIQQFRDLHITKQGYFASYNDLYHSPNGTTWNKVKDGGLPKHSVVGDTIYYLSGSAIRISPDGGLTFPFTDFLSPQKLPASLTYFLAVSHQLFFGGNADNNYRSLDGGNTWTPITTLPAATFGIVGAAFKNNKEGLLHQGVNGNFFYTTNGGETWSKGDKPTAQLGQEFYFKGEKLFNAGYQTYYTTDWGKNWKSTSSVINLSSIRDISFHNKTGMISGDNGEYAVTSDGGLNYYKPSENFTSRHINSCAVVNDSVLLAGNFIGEVWVSSNRGKTWKKVFNSAGNNTIRSFRWSNDGKILALRNLTSPIISTDYGQTFASFSGSGDFADFNASGQLISAVRSGNEILVRRHNLPGSATTPLSSINDPDFQIFNFIMASDQVGYIIGSVGNEKLATYRTSNGGNNWTRQSGLNNIEMTFSLSGSKVQTFGDQKIAISQDNYPLNTNTYNKLFLSNNSGSSWTVHEYKNPGGISDHDFSIHTAHFFDTDKFVLGGNNGLLYLNSFASVNEETTTSPTGILGNKSTSDVSIYPNPASTHINVSIQSMNNSEVYELKILNLAGQTISQFPIKSAYSTFELAEIDTGYYIYQISANSVSIKNGRIIIQ